MNFTSRKKVCREVCLFLLLMTLYTAVNAQTYVQDKQETRLDFVIRNMGLSVKGSFSEFSVVTNLMPDDLENSYLNAKILVGSIDTGIRKRNKHLNEDKYFNAPEYPEIRYESESFRLDEDGNLIMEGVLKIKSQTKRIAVPIGLRQQGEELWISSEFKVNRRDFGVGGKSWMMADQVDVKVKYKGRR